MVAKLIEIFTIYGVTVMFLLMGHPTEAKTVYQPDEPPTWYERKMLQLPVTGALATKIHRFKAKDLTGRIQLQPDEPLAWYERKILRIPGAKALATKIHQFVDKDLAGRIQLQPDETLTLAKRIQIPKTKVLATKIHRFQDKDLTTRIQPAESLTLPESIRSTERKTKLEKTFHKCLIKCELNAYSCKHATSYKHNKKPFNRGFCKKQKYLCLELC